MDKRLYFFVFLLWNFSAIFSFMAGLHNVDLAYNFKGFNDCNSFNCETMQQRYSWGLDAMIISFLMIIIELAMISAYQNIYKL